MNRRDLFKGLAAGLLAATATIYSPRLLRRPAPEKPTQKTAECLTVWAGLFVDATSSGETLEGVEPGESWEPTAKGYTREKCLVTVTDDGDFRTVGPLMFSAWDEGFGRVTHLALFMDEGAGDLLAKIGLRQERWVDQGDTLLLDPGEVFPGGAHG